MNIIRVQNRPSVIRSPACESFVWCDGKHHHTALRDDATLSYLPLRTECPKRRGFKRTDCDFWFKVELQESHIATLVGAV